MENDIAIDISGLYKKFKSYHNKETSLKYLVLNLLKGKRRHVHTEFWALKDISLHIQRGETVGFIGRNGSGKSTLMKLISRILYPDGGVITANGKISTLIELGAGFHPDLTGRENVYINASILGFSREEINRKFQDIVDFAGMEEFIDFPVKLYSSGMYVRLGFSVAINIDPDILLVDEVLAVGDEVFQKKCIQKIHEFKKQGKTIVFVSHDLHSVEQLCDRVFLLHNGRLVMDGAPVEAISEYHKLLVGAGGLHVRQGDDPDEIRPAGKGENKRWGNRAVEITDVRFFDGTGTETQFFKTGQPLIARICFNAASTVKKPVFGIAVYNEVGIHITGPNTRKHDFIIDEVSGRGYVEYEIPAAPFLAGTYLFTAAIYDFAGMQAYDHREQNWRFHVLETPEVPERLGLIAIPARWRLRHEN